MAEEECEPNECCPTAKTVSGNCSNTSVTLPSIPGDTPTIEIPTPASVTTEDVDGTGVFDIYMRAGLNQLMTQYDKDRIKGADFAAAYMATIELMMVEANKFVLGVVQAEIAAALFPIQFMNAQYEAAVQKSIIQKAVHESELVCQQVAELKANGAQDRALKESQTLAQCKTSELYDRQIKGFDEKNQNEIFKTVMDSWAIQGVDIIANQTESTLATLQKEIMDEVVLSAMKGTALDDSL